MGRGGVARHDLLQDALDGVSFFAAVEDIGHIDGARDVELGEVLGRAHVDNLPALGHCLLRSVGSQVTLDQSRKWFFGWDIFITEKIET